jgi:hypothetical protein
MFIKNKYDEPARLPDSPVLGQQSVKSQSINTTDKKHTQ